MKIICSTYIYSTHIKIKLYDTSFQTGADTHISNGTCDLGKLPIEPQENFSSAGEGYFNQFKGVYIVKGPKKKIFEIFSLFKNFINSMD